MSLHTHEYSSGAITDIEILAQFVDRLVDAGTVFGFDIETGYSGPDQFKASLKPEVGFIAGFSFAGDATWARYVPMRHDDVADNLDPKEVAPLLWKLLRTGNAVIHNAGFEISFLAPFFLEYLPDNQEVIESAGVISFAADSMLQAKVSGMFERVGLKELSKTVFNSEQASLDSLVPNLKKTKMDYFRFNHLSLTPAVISYACDDAVWCLLLSKYLDKKVESGDFILGLAYQLVPLLARMTQTGVLFDWVKWQSLLDEAERFSEMQVAAIQEMILERTGDPDAALINLNSPMQVGKLFYDVLGLPEKKDRKSGKRTTNAKAMKSLVSHDPIVLAVVEYKEVRKLIGSYLKKYLREFRYDPSGFTHPGYNQAGTITGRLSSSDPNIQQQPNAKRYEVGDSELYLDLRSCIIAPPDHYIVGMDFGQQEYRVLAGLTQDQSMLDAFDKGIDIHTATASKVFGVAPEDVTSEQRPFGKTLNFALIFQQGIDATADSLGVSESEAEEFMEQYFAGFPGVRPWMQASIAQARSDGYVKTYFGRKVPIFEYQSDNLFVFAKGDRLAINAQCQGTGADITFIALVRVQKAIEEAGLADKIKMCMTVHDAIYFYVHSSIDHQFVVDLLRPKVELNIPKFPLFVSEWCYGSSLGKGDLAVIE